MKRILFMATLLSLCDITLAGSIFDNGTWVNGNARVSTTKHDAIPIPGGPYDHTLGYTTPSGAYGGSEMCTVNANDPNTLSCFYSDSATYNPSTKQLVLHSMMFGDIVYYDQNAQPVASALSGEWNSVSSTTSIECNYSIQKLKIPYYPSGTTTFEHIDEDYKGGGVNNMNTFYIAQNKTDGRIALSPIQNQTYYNPIYLYDKNGKAITDINHINDVAILNDSKDKYQPQCDMKK